MSGECTKNARKVVFCLQGEPAEDAEVVLGRYSLLVSLLLLRGPYEYRL